MEAVEKQQREIAEISAREQAAAESSGRTATGVRAGQIVTEEEIGIAEENKASGSVAQRNKEKTDAVELERVK